MQERADAPVFSRKRMTPEELIEMAAFGRTGKTALAALLVDSQKLAFLVECAALERSYTCRCPAKGGTCLQGGCAMSEGEACLEALIKAEPDFSLRIYRIWFSFFREPANRIVEWR